LFFLQIIADQQGEERPCGRSANYSSIRDQDTQRLFILTRIGARYPKRPSHSGDGTCNIEDLISPFYLGQRSWRSTRR
jgi:hypothetical protein